MKTFSRYISRVPKQSPFMTRSMPLMAAPVRNFTTTSGSFMASDMTIERREECKEKPGPEHVYAFGGLSTDYMLEVDYSFRNGGW